MTATVLPTEVEPNVMVSQAMDTVFDVTHEADLLHDATQTAVQDVGAAFKPYVRYTMLVGAIAVLPAAVLVLATPVVAPFLVTVIILIALALSLIFSKTDSSVRDFRENLTALQSVLDSGAQLIRFGNHQDFGAWREEYTRNLAVLTTSHKTYLANYRYAVTTARGIDKLLDFLPVPHTCAKRSQRYMSLVEFAASSTTSIRGLHKLTP